MLTINDVKYIPYKEIAKQKALEYYYKNKEKVGEREINKYNSLSPKQEKKRQEYRKEWFNKLPIEKQQELREKSKQYQKNRCHNLMVEVK